MCDLGDGDVVRCHVIYGKTWMGLLRSKQNRLNNVANVDVGLALSPIPENRQPVWILHQLSQEIKTDPMSLPGPDYISKSENPAGKIKHMAISADESFTG